MEGNEKMQKSREAAVGCVGRFKASMLLNNSSQLLSPNHLGRDICPLSHSKSIEEPNAQNNPQSTRSNAQTSSESVKKLANQKSASQLGKSRLTNRFNALFDSALLSSLALTVLHLNRFTLTSTSHSQVVLQRNSLICKEKVR